MRSVILGTAYIAAASIAVTVPTLAHSTDSLGEKVKGFRWATSTNDRAGFARASLLRSGYWLGNAGNDLWV